MDQLVQILGSLLILAAYAAAQRGALDTRSRSYLTLNLVGSATLAVLAAREAQLGFLLLEASWALVSGWGLWLAVFRAARPSAGTPMDGVA